MGSPPWGPPLLPEPPRNLLRLGKAAASAPRCAETLPAPWAGSKVEQKTDFQPPGVVTKWSGGPLASSRGDASSALLCHMFLLAARSHPQHNNSAGPGESEPFLGEQLNNSVRLYFQNLIILSFIYRTKEGPLARQAVNPRFLHPPLASPWSSLGAAFTGTSTPRRMRFRALSRMTKCHVNGSLQHISLNRIFFPLFPSFLSPQMLSDLETNRCGRPSTYETRAGAGGRRRGCYLRGGARS